jgi:hypothetical protein
MEKDFKLLYNSSMYAEQKALKSDDLFEDVVKLLIQMSKYHVNDGELNDGLYCAQVGLNCASFDASYIQLDGMNKAHLFFFDSVTDDQILEKLVDSFGDLD